MGKISLNVPNSLSDLPEEERDLLLGRALRVAVKERVEQVEQELGEGQEKEAILEKKYGMEFEAFEKKVELQKFVGLDYQEDYHDWYFWRESNQRTQQILQNLRRFLADQIQRRDTT